VNSNISYAKARKLAFAPHINIGVFSLEKKSNSWEFLAKKFRTNFKRW
jgi:hypothetical protein